MGMPYRDLATPAPERPRARMAPWRRDKLLLGNLLASVVCVCVWLFRLGQPQYPREACVAFGLLSGLCGAGQYSEWQHRCRRARRLP